MDVNEILQCDYLTIEERCMLFSKNLREKECYVEEEASSYIRTIYDNFNDDKYFEFAITDKTTGKLYGAIALSNHQKFNNGELAYWIGEEYWGNGYATEAAKSILEFAFIEKGYNKVFARYFHSNPASGRVIEKIGMRKEGILREHVKKDDEYIDLVYFGILKHEANSLN